MLLAGTAISTGDSVPLTLLWFPTVALAHLDDYENTCKSYEQALTLDRSDHTHWLLIYMNSRTCTVCLCIAHIHTIYMYTHEHGIVRTLV